MKIPRDVSGQNLATVLGKLGYQITRQSGSHIRLSRILPDEHHITIPAHKVIKVGTLNAILADVANHLEMKKEDVVRKLWGP
ncbi:type II toxin-antitoxin system HicA family toxin, partial [bacterium]|nr:type II toxin-antitoxin system HicA family toxin [bacterium]